MAKKKDKKFYVDPKMLHKELMEWIKTKRMNDTLGKMLMDLVDGLAMKKNFSGYTWIDEMKGKAIEFLIKYGRNYNPEKENANAFAYCTSIARCAFIQVIQRENKQTLIRKNVYDALVTNEEGFDNSRGSSPQKEFFKKNLNISGNDDIILDLIEDYEDLVNKLMEKKN